MWRRRMTREGRGGGDHIVPIGFRVREKEKEQHHDTSLECIYFIIRGVVVH